MVFDDRFIMFLKSSEGTQRSAVVPFEVKNIGVSKVMISCNPSLTAQFRGPPGSIAPASLEATVYGRHSLRCRGLLTVDVGCYSPATTAVYGTPHAPVER